MGWGGSKAQRQGSKGTRQGIKWHRGGRFQVERRRRERVVGWGRVKGRRGRSVAMRLLLFAVRRARRQRRAVAQHRHRSEEKHRQAGQQKSQTSPKERRRKEKGNEGRNEGCGV